MARAAASLLIAGLGSVAAVAVVGASSADEPTPTTATATVYRTVTEHVQARYQGRGIRWWANRAVANRRALNAHRITLRRIRRVIHARWKPTARYGLALARTVYGIDQTRRAMCESRLYPFARNPSGATGVLQFLPATWASTPFGGFSIWDPVAQALAGGWMVRAGRSGEWSCGL